MKRLIGLFCMLFAFSCGNEDLMDTGTYDVSIYYVIDWGAAMDDDGKIIPKQGTTTEAEWEISKKEPWVYTMKVVGGRTTVDGTEEGNQVVFSKDKIEVKYGCETGSRFGFALTPNKAEGTFTGVGHSEIAVGTSGKDICKMHWLKTEVELYGEKR